MNRLFQTIWSRTSFFVEGTTLLILANAKSRLCKKSVGLRLSLSILCHNYIEKEVFRRRQIASAVGLISMLDRPQSKDTSPNIFLMLYQTK